MILTEGNISNISKNKIIFVMQLSQSNTAVINTAEWHSDHSLLARSIVREREVNKVVKSHSLTMRVRQYDIII